MEEKAIETTENIVKCYQIIKDINYVLSQSEEEVKQEIQSAKTRIIATNRARLEFLLTSLKVKLVDLPERERNIILKADQHMNLMTVGTAGEILQLCLDSKIKHPL